MSTLDIMPDEAICLDCGYLLRGLPGIVCPECGRAFNPDDSSTYGLAGNSRLRRRIRTVALLIVLSGLLYAIAPRGILHGKINMTCSECGLSDSVSRWELIPPSWLSFRYPGISLTNRTPAIDSSTNRPCGRHRFDVLIRLDLRNSQRLTTTTTYIEGEGEDVDWFGIPIAFSTLSDVIYTAISFSYTTSVGP